MPRHRVITLVWLTGAVLLLGAWGHSLFRDSRLVIRSAALDRHCELGIAAGSVVVHLRVEQPLHSPGVGIVSERWLSTPEPLPDPFGPPPPPPEPIPPPYFAGRFHTANGLLELPLWFVVLFLTAAGLPLYLRAREQRRAAEASRQAVATADPDPPKDELRFKLH